MGGLAILIPIFILGCFLYIFSVYEGVKNMPWRKGSARLIGAIGLCLIFVVFFLLVGTLSIHLQSIFDVLLLQMRLE